MSSPESKSSKTPISRLISRRCLNRIRRHCIPESGVGKKKYQRISRAFFDVARVSIENYVTQLVEHCVINAQSEKKQSCLLRHCEPSFHFKQTPALLDALGDDGSAVHSLPTSTTSCDAETACETATSTTDETKTLESRSVS